MIAEAIQKQADLTNKPEVRDHPSGWGQSATLPLGWTVGHIDGPYRGARRHAFDVQAVDSWRTRDTEAANRIRRVADDMLGKADDERGKWEDADSLAEATVYVHVEPF